MDQGGSTEKAETENERPETFLLARLLLPLPVLEQLLADRLRHEDLLQVVQRRHGQRQARRGERGADGGQREVARLLRPRDGAGDLFAVARIVVPRDLSDRERDLFRQLASGSSFDPRADLFVEAS